MYSVTEKQRAKRPNHQVQNAQIPDPSQPPPTFLNPPQPQHLKRFSNKDKFSPNPKTPKSPKPQRKTKIKRLIPRNNCGIVNKLCIE
jgi:hypothetical protein